MTSVSSTAIRKCNLTGQSSGSVENQDPRQGWIPDKYRAIAGPNQDTLDQERMERRNVERRNETLNATLANMLQGLRQNLGTNASTLSLQDIISQLLKEREELFEENQRVEKDLENIRTQFANHSEDAQIRLDKMQSELEQAREDSRLTREDAVQAREELEQAREDNRLTREDAVKAREESRLAQEKAHKAQRDMEAHEAELLMKARLSRKQPGSGSNNAANINPSSSNHNTPPVDFQPPANPQTPPVDSQPLPANPQTPPVNSQPNESAGAFDISTVIRETIKQLMAENLVPSAQTPASTPGGSRKRTGCSPREGSRAYDSNLKQEAFRALNAVQKTTWAAHLRQCFRKFTQRSKINDFDGYCPINEETAEAFGEGKGPGPQGDNRYRLYLSDGWRQAAWNHTVVANMAESMIAKAKELRIEPALTTDAVKATIWDFIKQARNSWSATKPRVHEGGERMESQSEALSRGAEYKSQRAQTVRTNTRKTQKYNDRKQGITDLLNDSSQTAFAKRRWEMMSEINEALHHEGQSSEESDYDCYRPPNQAPPLKITRPHYRRRVIGDLMEDLDMAIDKHRESTSRALGKRYVPRRSRIRSRTEVKSEHTVKRGLPKTLYHRRYLQRLNPTAFAQVKPRDDEVTHFAQYTLGVESDSMEE